MADVQPQRESRWRLVGNLAIGLLVLGAIGWWMLSSFTDAQGLRGAALGEWANLQTFVDKRWSRLRELHAIFDPPQTGDNVGAIGHSVNNPFVYSSPPVFLPGTPQYTFGAYQRWNASGGLQDRIELVQSIESSMSEFLKALEAEPNVKTNAVLSEFHREIALTQNDFQLAVGRYNSAAMSYNTMLDSFPRSIWLRRLDFQPLPAF